MRFHLEVVSIYIGITLTNENLPNFIGFEAKTMYLVEIS